MERVILGIDPGTVMMGYGVIKQVGKSIQFIEMDVLNLSKERDVAKKLHKIFECTVTLIEKHKPSCLAIEAPFFGKNVQSMLKLGRAQGVAIAAAMSQRVSIHEYAPRKIKMAITGKGTATKEQVAKMLFRLMSMDEIMPKYLDATDGLAVAVCHSLQNDISTSLNDRTAGADLQSVPHKKKSQPSKKYSGWDTFVAQNSTRVS
ncbi:MAG: crossover junction endodeoxyribonuclease RuvC [Bacteroidales bacterium]|jgi:crossover junction endodeoxyribonuclease RuvC|nr:crossover junction endodeoxyribonuclease RuvC [Bacteroidales bacterium]